MKTRNQTANPRNKNLTPPTRRLFRAFPQGLPQRLAYSFLFGFQVLAPHQTGAETWLFPETENFENG